MQRQPSRSRQRGPCLALISALVLGLGPGAAPAGARVSDPLLRNLEQALNRSGNDGLRSLVDNGPGLDPGRLENRHQLLRQAFSDARWSLSSGPDLPDGRSTLLVKVTGSRQEAGRSFRLEASQRLAVRQQGNRLTSQEVLAEESILRSGERDLPVAVLMPEEVLTGQRYDIDVVLDEPLKDTMLAGGVGEIPAEAQRNLRSPDLQLGALTAGGVFKRIQAPYKAGQQFWAVMLLHPQGTVSVSRLVRVVSRR
jgi:hypothetical protein